MGEKHFLPMAPRRCVFGGVLWRLGSRPPAPNFLGPQGSPSTLQRLRSPPKVLDGLRVGSNAEGSGGPPTPPDPRRRVRRPPRREDGEGRGLSLPCHSLWGGRSRSEDTCACVESGGPGLPSLSAAWSVGWGAGDWREEDPAGGRRRSPGVLGPDGESQRSG